jgi:hypothetical protein
MPVLQEFKGHFHISIPATIVQKNGWQKGDSINFVNIGDDTEPRKTDVALRHTGF